MTISLLDRHVRPDYGTTSPGERVDIDIRRFIEEHELNLTPDGLRAIVCEFERSCRAHGATQVSHLDLLVPWRFVLQGTSVLAVANTVSDERAAHVLKAAGYTDIHLGGYAWLDCSEDDSLKTSFTAKGPSGVRVEGAVCCGMLVKNCTIRLD